MSVYIGVWSTTGELAVGTPHLSAVSGFESVVDGRLTISDRSHRSVWAISFGGTHKHALGFADGGYTMGAVCTECAIVVPFLSLL